jgi:SWI/SNF-related matrix-associated actin-dependent regulator 1 of chromatin subfamily A
LPAKVRQVIQCDITNRKEYNKAEFDFVNYLKEVRGCTDKEIRKKLRGEMMVKIGILKQISARGKIDAARQYIDEVIESGQKIIVFCHLREIASTLKELYPSFVTIVGADSMEERQANITAFQTKPEVPGIICSLQAAGMGITLTAASENLFIEQPWTFALCDQAESRSHRIGQVESVRSGYLLGQNTIDLWCYDLIQKKKSIMQEVTGSSVEAEDIFINGLLELFNRKNTDEQATYKL